MQNEDNLKDDCIISFKTLKMKPSFFMYGKFQSHQQKWHVDQKEMFPLIKAFERCDYLIGDATKTINTFTDHKALKFIISRNRKGKQTNLGRLDRWA